MQDFRNLEVWQMAHDVTLAVYRETAAFPREEVYGLTSQMRRCGASIAANLAEGCGSGGDRSFLRHVRIAMGSACELEYHLLLAADLGYVNESARAPIQENLTRVKKMLTALKGRLAADSREPMADSPR
jgi:four helix bundle protein